jgi:hypothetical protein
VPTHLLQQYRKIGNEPKDTAVPHRHSDILVTMNVYTHIRFDDAKEKLKRIEDFRKTQTEIEKRMRNQCSRKWITLRIGWGIICCEKNNLMIRLHRNFMYRIKRKEK